ncbi:MAG TPA: hypothetical protein PKK06_06480 [Phycisphaerae bacterium]|nr:hypothetical protein [Phycisphaerae bacterium]HNU44507.1 hypothetical protein [Phycisphaerae bacterium]
MASVSRKQFRSRRSSDAQATRLVNRGRKLKERARRDARLVRLLQTAPFPYTSTVMAWLSHKLGKPVSRITAEDARHVLG